MMNKYKEAFANVKRACIVPFLGRKPIDICGVSLDILKELVERATPQKLDMMRIKKYDGYNLGVCQCGQAIEEYMIDSGVKYCPKCGQAIYWE